MTQVFIDGSSGTTGLRIRERLEGRQELTLITLPEESRKDPEARRNALNSADVAILCLPDAAAIEAVSLITNPNTIVLDASTARRLAGPMDSLNSAPAGKKRSGPPAALRSPAATRAVSSRSSLRL